MCLVAALRGNQSLPKDPLRLAHESGLGVTLASRQAGFAPPCPAQEAGSVARVTPSDALAWCLEGSHPCFAALLPLS